MSNSQKGLSHPRGRPSGHQVTVMNRGPFSTSTSASARRASAPSNTWIRGPGLVVRTEGSRPPAAQRRAKGRNPFLKPYYGDAVWYGAEEVNGEQSVSDVQLFLDLVHYPVRGPEAAAALLKQRLGARLKLSPEQVRTLREGLGL